MSDGLFSKKKENSFENSVVYKEPTSRSLLRRYMLAVAVSCLVAIGVLKAVISSRSNDIVYPDKGLILSNGTNSFLPTVIMISLDGFRADYIYRGHTPNLLRLAENNAHAPYMIPVFPSITFPNHYSLATGLYPENHGMVSNNFYDPITGKYFVNTRPECNRDPVWWTQAEPIWINAERHSVRSAVHMWPGNEVPHHGIRPSYYTSFNASATLKAKKNELLHWLDHTDDTRPQLLMCYVPHVDSVGHTFGPDSPQLNLMLKEVDQMVGDLLEGLNKRNLQDVVNLIFVSDHGMAPTSNDRLLWLDDLFNVSKVEFRDGWPLAGFRGESESDETYIADSLKNATSKALPGTKHWKSSRKEEMPDSLHYSKNNRIAPVWMVPDPGWSIVSSLDHSPDVEYEPYGVHGYDNNSPLMRAIFTAFGPAFKPFKSKQLMPFRNVEVYDIISYILNLPANSTNSSFHGAIPTKKSSNSTKEWLLHDIRQAYDELKVH
ncbi:nucleotide pyrophosphatase [Schizosaccharomyces octosporus yFS286]|uniref:Nucleotide pyrophosphatase n=1 Tax=Schizosaccharomyces octosporus (strain yFS286) TaxID=483514 RepID=S9RJR9_SCHOY|nr:nucleotide pyrophosphatase [Schizosaccharomyces octosporus yFS286]EPX74219.1 nucleotide pyrophosphatase [Schizosaccharomyces octosporus yFS286]